MWSAAETFALTLGVMRTPRPWGRKHPINTGQFRRENARVDEEVNEALRQLFRCCYPPLGSRRRRAVEHPLR